MEDETMRRMRRTIRLLCMEECTMFDVRCLFLLYFMMSHPVWGIRSEERYF